MLPAPVQDLWRRLGSIEVTKVIQVPDVGAGWDGLGIHRHRTASAALALEGVVRLEIGQDRHLDLAAGELALIGPWVWHAHPPPRIGAVAIIGLRYRDVDVCLMWGGNEWIGMVPRVERDPAAACLVPGASLPVMRRLRRWLSAGTPSPDATPEPLRLMSDFLWRHRIGPVGAAAVLARSGLGYSAANRLFREHFGSTVKQYLLCNRLELAERLLRDGRQPGEIWAVCGFTSRADFTRRFRLTHGEAPRRWARPNGGRHRDDAKP